MIPPYNLTIAYRKGWREEQLRVSRAAALQQQQTIEHDLRMLAGRDNVIFADLRDALCNGPNCKVIVDGASLYSDSNHLSAFGARFVVPAFAPCLAKLKGNHN
jgi:hypothetical protein